MIQARPSANMHLPCARATRLTDQAVGSAVASAIVWTGIEYDAPGTPQTMWSGANPSRLTAPVDGLYYATACANMTASASGIRQFYINHNTQGSRAMMNSSGPTNANQMCVVVSADFLMLKGEYIEFYCYQSSGGILNITSGYKNSMSLRLVYPTSSQDWS